MMRRREDTLRIVSGFWKLASLLPTKTERINSRLEAKTNVTFRSCLYLQRMCIPGAFRVQMPRDVDVNATTGSLF